MKERDQNLPDQIESENATLDFVNYQAQEAILNPNLPNALKDKVLGIAIDTIQKVAERRAAHHAKYGEGRRTRRPK